MARYMYLTILLFLISSLVCKSEFPSVIIVGAGVSGIAAASELLENGIWNLTILEAKDRIGGRIHTVPFGNGVVDLGAQWCHGEKDNIVYEMANKYDLLGSEEVGMKFFYSTGKPLDQDFMMELFEVYEKAYENHSGNISIGEYFTNSYTEMIHDLYKNDQDKLKLATEALEAYLKIITGLQGAFTAFFPSAEYDFVANEGHPNLNWKKRGYKILLDILIKKFPHPEQQLPIDDKIILNKEVVEIIWNDGRQVSVKCSDGSVYRADQVIVTVSLGVLKHSHRVLFSPALTEEKISAIENLGFHTVGKIFLRFDNSWWKSKNSSSHLRHEIYWNKEDKSEFFNSTEVGKTWLLAIDSLYVEETTPDVLLVWLTGPWLLEIEHLTDDVVSEGIMIIIRKFLGNFYEDITPPNAIIRHNWWSDPHIRGTYSFQTVESRQQEESPEFILSKPLGDSRVLFAGEATNPIHYSTVHGALESGFREARRIIDLYH